MTTFEYLMQVQEANKKIKNLRKEIAYLTAEAASVSAIDYTRESVQNGKTEKEPSFVRVLDQLAEHRKKLEEMLLDYYALREKIQFQINSLSNANQATVLYMRFFENKTLQRIAIEKNYSVWQIRNFYRDGKREFRKKFEVEFDNE